MSENGQTDEFENYVAPILTLPPEIRGQIFNLLSAKDASTCRLACYQFKVDVDEFVEFTADLDETQGNENGWFLPRILNLRLRAVTVNSLMGPPCLFGLVGTQILRYPHLLRRLKVINSKISLENLHHLLRDCSTSLHHLDLSLVPPLSTASTGIAACPSAYQLRNVTHLSISMSSVLPTTETATEFVEAQVMRGLPTVMQNDTIPILILTSQFDSIQNIRIQIRCLGFRQVSQLSALVLQLVSRCYKTLKSFDFDLIQGHGLPTAEEKPLSDTDMDKLDIASLSKVTLLEDIRIVNSTAIGISLWKKLLASQKKLYSMETDILPASASLFRQIILNNASTLVSVDIGDLTLDINEDTGTTLPFDLSVFSNCDHLEKLTLDRNSLVRRRGPVLDSELVQLANLPEKLSELNLNYFLIHSEEFMLFLNIHTALTSLSLTQCGDSGLFGVHGSALQKIISLPNIQFIEISPLNFNVNATEAYKLNIILTTFGYPERHSYFQLNRVDAATPENMDDTEDRFDMDDLEIL